MTVVLAPQWGGGGPQAEAPPLPWKMQDRAGGCLTDYPAQKRIHTKALSPIWTLDGLAPESVAPLAGSLARAVCSCESKHHADYWVPLHHRSRGEHPVPPVGVWLPFSAR